MKTKPWILVFLLVACAGCGPYVVKTIKLPHDRAIVIMKGDFADPLLPLWYIVRVKGAETTKGHFIGGYEAGATLAFEVLTNATGNLVAVVETNRPEDLLIIHDFDSGKSWPRDEDDGSVVTDLLARVREAYPDRKMRIDHLCRIGPMPPEPRFSIRITSPNKVHPQGSQGK